MELTPDQLERLFRNLERVATLADSVAAISKRVDHQDEKFTTQEEQHEENLARLTAMRDTVTEHQQEERASRQRVFSTMEELRGQTTKLQETTNEMREEFSGRIARLETPFRRALARRNARRKLWVRVSVVISSVAAFLWLALEPARRVLIEWLMASWLPPHK